MSILKRKNSIKNNKHIEWNDTLSDGNKVIDNSANDTDILNGLTDLDLGYIDSFDNIQDNEQTIKLSNINEEINTRDVISPISNMKNEDLSLISISDIPTLDDINSSSFPIIQDGGVFDFDYQNLKKDNIINDKNENLDINKRFYKTPNSIINVIKDDD